MSSRGEMSTPLKIHIEYDQRTEPDLLCAVLDISKKHGSVSTRKWGSRVGALDLVSILEVVGIYIALKAADGFTEGLINKEWFTHAGKKTRDFIAHELRAFSQYLGELFDQVIVKNKKRYGAICIIEHIAGVDVYAVLNHEQATRALLASLPEALSLVEREIVTNGLPDDSPRVVQLLPNFRTSKWDFLLVPSNDAFGHFANRFLDLRDGQYYPIQSPEEFMRRFDYSDWDSFKYLIAPVRRHDRDWSSKL